MNFESFASTEEDDGDEEHGDEQTNETGEFGRQEAFWRSSSTPRRRRISTSTDAPGLKDEPDNAVVTSVDS